MITTVCLTSDSEYQGKARGRREKSDEEAGKDEEGREERNKGTCVGEREVGRESNVEFSVVRQESETTYKRHADFLSHVPLFSTLISLF